MEAASNLASSSDFMDSTCVVVIGCQNLSPVCVFDLDGLVSGEKFA